MSTRTRACASLSHINNNVVNLPDGAFARFWRQRLYAIYSTSSQSVQMVSIHHVSKLSAGDFTETYTAPHSKQHNYLCLQNLFSVPLRSHGFDTFARAHTFASASCELVEVPNYVRGAIIRGRTEDVLPYFVGAKLDYTKDARLSFLCSGFLTLPSVVCVFVCLCSQLIWL